MTDHRNIITQKFIHTLEETKCISWEDKPVRILAENLEKSILNKTISDANKCGFNASFEDRKFLSKYKVYFQKVYFNLFKNKCSESVRNRIKDGEFELTDIVTMPHTELNPLLEFEACKLYDRKVFIYGLSDEMKELQKERKSGIRCPKCKSDQVEYTQLQTRSGDEGISNFALCVCGKRWKFS